MHEIKEIIILWASTFPSEWATFLLAMMPVTELRASIPLAITVFKMPWWEAFLYSFLGNLFLGAVVLFLGETAISYIVKHISPLSRLWHRYIERVKMRNAKKFKTWGSLALILFVAIPLPITGAFTGAIAASLFKIPYWRALSLLALGIFVAGCLVTLLTLGAMGVVG